VNAYRFFPAVCPTLAVGARMSGQVLASGHFDRLHGGHVAFLQAAAYGGLSGAGGGGYLIVVSREPVASALRIGVRRGND
jgi:phosphopantetheine adenylyltransferase